MKKIKDGYAEGLIELAKQKEDLIVLSAHSAKETGVKKFASEHPDRFIHCGEAEQTMMGMATGFEMEGKIPFVSTCVALGKNWDQIRDICYKNLNVKIADSHKEAFEDIALTRALPNITIIIPADYNQAKKATLAAGTTKGPVYIRLATEKAELTTEKTSFVIGRVEIMRAGKDCTIITCGPILHDAMLAAEKLAKQEIECTVLDCHTIQPIDKHAIISSARLTGCMVTAEQNSGGLGSAVAEILSQHTPVPMRMVKTENETIIKIVKAVKEVVMKRCETVCPEILEEHGRKLHMELQPELYFKLRGGGMIRNIPGLHKALLNMNDEIFTHHCNTHKNDFSTWVKEVFKEPALAKNLEQKHTKLGMALELARWLT